MKKYAFLTAALLLSISLTGCTGGKNAVTETDAPQDTTAASGTADEIAATPKYDEYFTDADKDIDMDAIKGDKAKTADDSNAKGEVNGAEVKIADAKVVEYNDRKSIIVSFEFKNNTASDVTFNGLLRTEANQEDAYLTNTLMLETEGFVPETYIQSVKSGETITVQRAFDLFDDTTPVTITVENAVNVDDDARVTKTFDIH